MRKEIVDIGVTNIPAIPASLFPSIPAFFVTLFHIDTNRYIA